ncbi:MAG: tRNA pseudouridine(55) synthase TruB [Gemmatimonadales bacterium]
MTIVGGGILIDKPAGWTSHDAVAVIRRRLDTRAVGHGGTLDPFATGLLVVMVGRTTRLARFVTGMSKQYHAVIRFGTATDTDDATGTVIRRASPDLWPEIDAVRSMLARLTGNYPQRPPAFSAKHVAGSRSHKLARRGEKFELPPVPVTVHRLELIEWSPPDLTVEAEVGAGTYLRALARDAGDLLGFPAHCAELRRTAVGPFAVDAAIAPGDVTPESLMPAAALLPGMPTEVVDDPARRDLGFGRAVPQQQPREGAAALVAPDGRLVAAAEGRAGWWHPVVVFEAQA